MPLRSGGIPSKRPWAIYMTTPIESLGYQLTDYSKLAKLIGELEGIIKRLRTWGLGRH